MIKKFLILVPALLLVLAAAPAALRAQDAEDIVVPPGYKVDKIAETNKANDCSGMAVDAEGNLIVAGAFLVYKVDAEGNVQVIASMRRFDISPSGVAPVSDGSILLMTVNTTTNAQAVHRFTPPDTYDKLFEANTISSIRFDKLGNFYACLRKAAGDPPQIIRYDADYHEAEIVSSPGFFPRGLAFDSGNNLYCLEVGAGRVWKIPAGADGRPGSDDVPVVFAESLSYPAVCALDAQDNIYIAEWDHTTVSGYSYYDIYRVTKVTPLGEIVPGIAADVGTAAGMSCKDGSLYVSDFIRAAIVKIDLSTLAKSDFTHDYGIATAGNVAFDPDERLYTHSFRQLALFRLGAGGQFSQVGPGTGYAQSIASDGTYFYLGSFDVVSSNGNQVLKFDPFTESFEPLATHLRGWRSVAFDAYGRLILNSVLSQTDFGLDIIDLTSGGYTPYVVGLHNKARCIQFDANQNLYCVEGIGDGIKKVALAESYDPPRDISTEPLFYDLRTQPYPPAIYFFGVNPQQEVFIPRMDTGEVLLGLPDGTVQPFASGFLCPTNFNINKYGELYVSDMANGLFRIITERWTVPAVIELNEDLLNEVLSSLIEGGAAAAGAQTLGMTGAAQGGNGIKNSLVKKLRNVDKHLKAGKVQPAIGQLGAFINEVKAQSGKAIPADLAASWVKQASGMVRALEDVA